MEKFSKINESFKNFNYMIDYTYLPTKATYEGVEESCEIVKKEKFHGIVVPDEFVSYTVGYLNDPKIKVISVLDFPKGEKKTTDKLKDVRSMIAEGVNEVDMVLNIKLFQKTCELEDKLSELSDKDDMDEKDEIKNKIKDNLDYLETDIRSIVYECHKNGVLVKIIIETGVLTIDQIRKLSTLLERTSIDYVMTSTGKNGLGIINQIEKLKTLRTFLPEHIKIKASGGIRSIDQIKNVFNYVDRIGTSVVPK